MGEKAEREEGYKGSFSAVGAKKFLGEEDEAGGWGTEQVSWGVNKAMSEVRLKN